MHRKYLEVDICAHGLSMGDNDLSKVVSLAVPTVQFDTSAPRQKNLSVDLHTGFAAKLSAGQVRIVTGIDVVVGHRLVHILVDVQSIQKDGRIFVG